MTSLRLWTMLRRGASATSRLPELLAILAFAVATGSMLVVLGGVHAMLGRFEAGVGDDLAQFYLILTVVASGLMVIGILTLGAQAARLTLARRNERLAALRLCGATVGQTSLITLYETLSQAVVGIVLGIGLYAGMLPLLSLISFQGIRLDISELWFGPWWLLGGVAAVVALALVSGTISLARVAITPLGVANRVTPKSVTVVRVVVAVGLLSSWPVLFELLDIVALIVLALGIVLTINLVGPWLVMMIGAVMARTARTAPTLLAARRILDDPRTAWRSCSAFALVIMLATLSSYGALLARIDASQAMLAADLSTGAVITLVIVSIVAATSSGVIHASRVIDQAPVYRSLSLAGTEISVLDATRIREIMWPLAATALTAGSFAALLLVPLSLEMPLALPRFAIAVLGSAALTVLALTASRPLLRRAVSATST